MNETSVTNGSAASNGALTSSLRSSLDSGGYVLLPSLLSPDAVSRLRTACSALTERARAGQWPYLRTLPKQFPPWSSDPSHGIWGVQHLLHPSQADAPLFAASYFDPHITRTVAEICTCNEDDLVMELYNLLITPDRDFALRWHRDDIPATATVEEEEAVLLPKGQAKREYAHAQWNLALYDDESLIVVPGSHRRARTYVERHMDPFADELPDMIVVKLKAGDVVFYDNNILHRGVYKADTKRLTLHGSMGRLGKSEQRARNVLQHGVGEWVDQCRFEELEPEVRERAEGMRRRLVEMGRGKKVEYSQPD
jgi:Phytanoyl-CoA dioxygenase (PhyH)